MRAILALCALSLLTTGCTLFDRQERRINYTEDLDVGPSSLITDAKQRLIINTEAKVGIGDATYTVTTDSRTGLKKYVPSWDGNDKVVKNHPNRIICAEPSPDVAQAISAAFTAAAEVEIKKTEASGDNEQARGAGNFGSSYAASVAQLGERLATVQLLRDKMYRACEAYQNGAISDTSYTLMLARFDKTMASMLAAEVAAGAFGRNLAALGGSASTSNADPKKIEEARKAVEKASSDLEAAAGKADSPEKTAAIAKAKQELTTALADLASLAYQSGGTSAQSGPVGGGGSAFGQIVGRTAIDADAVALINTNYLDDDASGTLIDACVVALDRDRSKKPSPEQQALLYGIVLEIDRKRAELSDRMQETSRLSEEEFNKRQAANSLDTEADLAEQNASAPAATTMEKQAASNSRTQATQAQQELNNAAQLLDTAKQNEMNTTAQLQDAEMRYKAVRATTGRNLADICSDLLDYSDNTGKNVIAQLQDGKEKLRKSAIEFAKAQTEAEVAKFQAAAEEAKAKSSDAQARKAVEDQKLLDLQKQINESVTKTCEALAKASPKPDAEEFTACVAAYASLRKAP